MKSELIDIFDENMELVGSASRAVAHTFGLWHQTFHCWIVSQDSEGKYLLFQKRSSNKELFPDALDITAAGHILTGEMPEDGIREIEEEIGLKVDFDSLSSLGVRCEVVNFNHLINREFCHTFLYEHNADISGYKLDKDEVASLVKIKISDGLSLFSGETGSVLAKGIEVNQDNKQIPIELQVTKESIIPRLDRYYFKMFKIADLYFKGSSYLAV